MEVLDEKKNIIYKLLDKKKSKDIFRLGKLFDTDENHYYYDVGTGKVIQLDEVSYKILSFLFDENDNTSWEKLEEQYHEQIEELGDFLEEQNLFAAPLMKKLMTHNHGENLEFCINENLNQVILELTEICNLRCRYCIYNDTYDGNRNFNTNNMSKEVAKAAIDYTKKHCRHNVAVTFYGGEPLVNFDLLKWSIEYAKEEMKDMDLSFSFTTNLTLMTKEIAEYLATVDNLTVLCSIDGPEEVHNRYRKYVNGEGTFNDVMRGLRYLVDAFDKNPTDRIAINGVFAPPYTFENVKEINDFFAGLDWLPDYVDVSIDYVSDGTVDDKEHLESLKQLPEYREAGYFIDTLYKFGVNEFNKSDNFQADSRSVYSTSISKKLYGIHNRPISDKPMENYPFNSCCIPGSRRIYVTTKGDLYVCEKIGNSPKIGNVFDGIDFKTLKEKYIDEYSKQSTKYCSKCWAVRLCNQCYVGNYTEDGLDIETKTRDCAATRHIAEKELILYHSILEKDPEKLEFLNKIQVS